ncbi:MAG: ferrochelatase [Deltaproteobacteria bacterium]|nr:ferrochelatase [Deltaproteobacteria bacterium]
MHRTALLVTAHGTVDSLDEIPAFLQIIRRGRPAPPELLDEVRAHYEAIGGRSPHLAWTSRVAEDLANALQIRSQVAMRLWHPTIASVVPSLLAEGFDRVVSLPLAPYSVEIYHAPVAQALSAAGLDPAQHLVRVDGYHLHPALIEVFATRLRSLLGHDATRVIFTAHSLPMSVVTAGDPYPTLVRETAVAVANACNLPAPQWQLAYQSQGAVSGAWLGPTVSEALDQARADGIQRVVFSPIGFLSDHVEILYDLDIDAASQCASRGLSYARTATPNADDDLCAALCEILAPYLAP